MTAAAELHSPKLTDADLAALISGGEGQRIPLEKIYAGQLGKHKLLICAVVRFGASAVPAAGSELREHYDLLATVERKAPDAVAAVLRHPHVGAWAARCMRQLSGFPARRNPTSAISGPSPPARRSGPGMRARSPSGSGTGPWCCPALGRAPLSGRTPRSSCPGRNKAVIESGDQTITVLDPRADAPGWQAPSPAHHGRSPACPRRPGPEPELRSLSAPRAARPRRTSRTGRMLSTKPGACSPRTTPVTRRRCTAA